MRFPVIIALAFEVLVTPVSPGADSLTIGAGSGADRSPRTVRVAACQARSRVVDWRLAHPPDVLAAVDRNLAELESIIHRAAEQKCDVLAFPEDTPGLLQWVGVNESLAKEVLPEAVRRMIDRLGRAAASHHMYLVVCSDLVEADGGTYNTAFFLGRDGREMGRYHKVCPTWAESGARLRGGTFPVFETPDCGTVGLAICYDLVMPETTRCLALAGADIVFFPTMGTAAIGDDDIGLQALRVRAVENFLWLVVAHRGGGAMVISPQGKIIAQAEGPDGLAVADIDPHGGRSGGDSSNWQPDMRARLFRERNPAAFGLLTDPQPPALKRLPLDLSREEAGRIMARMLTRGEVEFKAADTAASLGNRQEAIAAFERLRADYPATWIDRVSKDRLAKLRSADRRAEASQANAVEASPNPGVKPKKRLRVAGAQIPVARDVSKNIEAISRAIDFAAEEKADVLVTPEGSLSGYSTDFDAGATARGLEAVLAKARAAGVALVLGTCYEEADGQRYDQQRFYDRQGEYLGYHAKILLCRRAGTDDSPGELGAFRSAPLRTRTLEGLTVGGLICNDLWANPEWTPMADPHLAQQLAGLGARVIFVSANSGQAQNEELALNRSYHESNLRLRARAARAWMVVVDACDPQGQRAANCPSGLVSPEGQWVTQVDVKGERYFCRTIEVEQQ